MLLSVQATNNLIGARMSLFPFPSPILPLSLPFFLLLGQNHSVLFHGRTRSAYISTVVSGVV